MIMRNRLVKGGEKDILMILGKVKWMMVGVLN